MTEFARIRARVVPSAGGKTFYLLVGEKIVGESKLQCDADFHMHLINEALELEYQHGYQAGVNMVASGE